MRTKIFSAFVILSVTILSTISPVHADANLTVVGITSTGSIVKFAGNAPGTIDSTVALSGLQTNENFVGIDFRPADGLLYGITNQSRLYRIDPTTGLTTIIGSQFATLLTGTIFGVDFNPAVDRIRVIGDDEQNVRINPANGDFVASDTALAYGANDANFSVNPNIGAVAYSNNLAAATATTLLGIDSALATLVRIGGPNATPSPNGGEITSLGSLGIGTNLTNVAFDIANGKTSGSQVGLLAATLNGETVSKLFTVDLAGGNVTLVGTVGNSLVLTGIAVTTNDQVSPIALISSVNRIRIGDLIAGELVASVSCSELCSISSELEFTANAAKRLGLSNSGPVTIATATSNVADAGVTDMTLLISNAAKSALQAAASQDKRRFRMFLEVTVTDAAGNVTVVSKFLETI